MNKSTVDSLSGRSLIVGCPGAGSLGQLTVDLLVSGLKMASAGSVYSPALCPFAGADPYVDNSSNLASAADVYVAESQPIAVLIFRSPVGGRHSGEFVQQLAQSLKDAKIVRVVWVTGFTGDEKRAIESTPFGRVANEFLSDDDLKAISSLDWEVRDASAPVRGGRFAKKAHDACTALAVPSLVLYKYCHEGDNVADATLTVQQMNVWLRMFDEADAKLKTPRSWKFLQSRPAPDSLY